MPRQRLRTVTVELPDGGGAVLVTPDEDLPEGVKDSDINERAFEPWGGEEEFDVSGLEYDDMTAKELSRLVKDRGLEPESNRKADLITALEENDAGQQ